MEKAEIEKFILDKENRHLLLQERLVALQELKSNLSSNLLSKWFGKFALFIQRYLTMIFGLALIIVSIIFFFSPDWVNSTLQKSQEYIYYFIALLLFVLALFLLYISRLTKKMQIRDNKITEAEKFLQLAAKDYAVTIEEEDKELQIIKNFL